MCEVIPALSHAVLLYHVHEVVSYINWIYFFHAWGFKPRFAAIADIHDCNACRASWLTAFSEEERPKATEAMQLFEEANKMNKQLNEDMTVQCVFRLFRANADGDNLIIEDTPFPLLRQQPPHPDGIPFLCLSDFVRPLSSGIYSQGMRIRKVKFLHSKVPKRVTISTYNFSDFTTGTVIFRPVMRLTRQKQFERSERKWEMRNKSSSL